MNWFSNLMCLMRLCLHCELHSNNYGVGMKCARCGRVDYWTPREVLDRLVKEGESDG